MSSLSLHWKTVEVYTSGYGFFQMCKVKRPFRRVEGTLVGRVFVNLGVVHRSSSWSPSKSIRRLQLQNAIFVEVILPEVRGNARLFRYHFVMHVMNAPIMTFTALGSPIFSTHQFPPTQRAHKFSTHETTRTTKNRNARKMATDCLLQTTKRAITTHIDLWIFQVAFLIALGRKFQGNSTAHGVAMNNNFVW